MVLAIISTLNDAEYLLHECRGIPETMAGKRRSQVFARAIILFSWIATEEVARYEAMGQPGQSAQPKLWDRLFDLLQKRQLEAISMQESHVMKADFLSIRKIRNALTHPDAAEQSPTFEQAQKTFHYCKSLIGKISSNPISPPTF